MPTAGLIGSHMRYLIFIVRHFEASLIGGALYLACLLTGETWTFTHWAAFLFTALLYSIVGEANHIYGPWRGAPMKRELISMWSTYLVTVPVLIVAWHFSHAHQHLGDLTAAAWLITTPILLIGSRASMRIIVQEFRQRGRNTRRVAIAGATDAALQLRHTIDDRPWFGMVCAGFYDDRIKGPGDQVYLEEVQGPSSSDGRLVAVPQELGKFRGDFERLVADARAGKFDIVFIALPLRAEGRIRDLIAQLADTTATVHVVADVLLSELMQSRISEVGDMPVFNVFDHPFHGVDGTLKRVEDFVLGTLIMGLIAIPMGIIAVAIKMTSKGPVLFKQRRYGLNGEEISILKFRSMTVAEDGDKVVQATKNDVRITKLGAFLRRTSLDELPQFFHVLTGKMSIVGPRPHAVAHNEQYRRLIPGYMLRHKVKPGITGWAQVNGWRGETDTIEKMEKRVECDLAYIRGWALMLDLRIIFLTVFGKAVRNNAY